MHQVVVIMKKLKMKIITKMVNTQFLMVGYLACKMGNSLYLYMDQLIIEKSLYFSLNLVYIL